MTPPAFRSGACSEAGAHRRHNEDAFVHRPEIGLWAVADGAGGHQRGDVASGMIRAALSAVPEGLAAGQLLAELRHRIARTHEELVETGRREGGVVIASTLVALMIRHGHFACLWAGDSRLYRLRGGVLERISHDHSVVQELVDGGTLAPEDAESHPRANVITRAVGAGEGELETEKRTDRVLPGDRFLLCSDGLTRSVAEAEIESILAKSDPAQAAELLVSAALARDARDNVTAVTIEAMDK